MNRLAGTILVVDDHVALAENLAEILSDVGYETAWTDSAESALDTVERGGISAIITDYCLPGLNGAQLIAELRRRGVDIPAVVMSAHTDPETIGSSENAGALQIFSKPVDVARLIRMVEVLDRGETSVLVVEDNRSLADNLAEALREAGHQVIIGESGAAALSYPVKPGIAIVDYVLPDGNGIELAERLTARDPRIRIMFVSGHGDDLERELEKQVRPLFDAPRMAKPIDVSRLLAWVGEGSFHGKASGPRR